MSKPKLSPTQVEILKAMCKDGRKVIKPLPQSEFPYAYILQPEGKSGGLALGNSPVASLLKRGYLVHVDGSDLLVLAPGYNETKLHSELIAPYLR